MLSARKLKNNLAFLVELSWTYLFHRVFVVLCMLSSPLSASFGVCCWRLALWSILQSIRLSPMAGYCACYQTEHHRLACERLLWSRAVETEPFLLAFQWRVCMLCAWPLACLVTRRFIQLSLLRRGDGQYTAARLAFSVCCGSLRCVIFFQPLRSVSRVRASICFFYSRRSLWSTSLSLSLSLSLSPPPLWRFSRCVAYAYVHSLLIRFTSVEFR